MNNDDLQKLKAAATAVENHGVIRYMTLPTSEILALIAEVESTRAMKQEPIGFISPRLLESLTISRECAKIPSNHSVEVQAGPRHPGDIPVFTGHQESPIVANGWIPIETAPEDGQYVLTCGRKYHSEHEDFWYETAFYRGSSGLFDYLDGEDVIHYQPSHWMPSPNPPQ